MTDREPDKGVDNGTQAPPAQPPASSPTPLGAPLQPQQVACPRCLTVVLAGTRFCPQCGSSIPPTWPSVLPLPTPTPKRNVALIVGVVLIAVLIVGVAGYVVYQHTQQQILLAAKNSERDAASQAINQIQLKCFSNGTTSNLSYSQYGDYSGYMTVYEEFGISNPTKFAMDVIWTITLDYPSAGLLLTDTARFHLLANGAAYPTFAFRISGSQLNNLPANADFSRFTATSDENYTVAGTYAAYELTQHSTYDSSANTGTGPIGSSGSLPKCAGG